jgi:hypothetical protein
MKHNQMKPYDGEAAAMTLATRIDRALNLQQANYLTDNQLLVNFFNNNSHSDPPDWRMKPLTQEFIHSLGVNPIKVYKIARQMNSTSHSLAKQVHGLPAQPPVQAVFSCSDPAHVNQCPVKNALASINMLPFICDGEWLHHRVRVIVGLDALVPRGNKPTVALCRGAILVQQLSHTLRRGSAAVGVAPPV